jgi:hypothetical protein
LYHNRSVDIMFECLALMLGFLKVSASNMNTKTSHSDVYFQNVQLTSHFYFSHNEYKIFVGLCVFVEALLRVYFSCVYIYVYLFISIST